MTGSDDRDSSDGKNEGDNKPHKIWDRLKAAQRHFRGFIRHSFSRPDNFPLHLNWIFTAFLACFAFYAWQEATHTTSTLQEQLWKETEHFELDERPILALAQDQPQPIMRYDPQTMQFRWNYWIKNYGKTTALNVKMFEYVSILGGHFKSIAHYRVGSDLVPTQEFRSTVFDSPFAKDTIETASKIDDGIIIKIILRYRNAAGTQLETPICQGLMSNSAITNCLVGDEPFASIPTDNQWYEQAYK